MKIPEDDLHQAEHIWDDLVEQHLQFASKSEWKTGDEAPHLLKVAKQHQFREGFFEIVAKSK